MVLIWVGAVRLGLLGYVDIWASLGGEDVRLSPCYKFPFWLVSFFRPNWYNFTTYLRFVYGVQGMYWFTIIWNCMIVSIIIHHPSVQHHLC